MRGHVGVRAASFCPAPLVVPALGDRLGAGVGDEVVIDVVHAGDHRVRGQHRGREHPLQLQRVGPVGDRGQPRAQRPQTGQRGQPGQRPGLGGGQVLELLRRRRAQREAHADRRQQRHVLRRRRPAAAGPSRRRPARGTRAAASPPRTGTRHAAGRGRRAAAGCPAAAGPGPAASPGSAAPDPAASGSAAAGCGCGAGGSGSCTCARPSRRSTVDWFTPSRRAISASRTPAARHARACSHDASPVSRGRPGGADQRRRPVPQRPLVQRRHVIRRQPQHRGDLRAAEPQLPQRRHRDVPHRGVVLGEPEQRRRPGEDHRLPVRAQPCRSRSFRHALQDGSTRG